MVSLSKKKAIQKQRVSSHLNRPSTKEDKPTATSKSMLKKVAKQVNLSRPKLSLEEIQQIFHKVVDEHSSKKVKRK